MMELILTGKCPAVLVRETHQRSKTSYACAHSPALAVQHATGSFVPRAAIGSARFIITLRTRSHDRHPGAGRDPLYRSTAGSGHLRSAKQRVESATCSTIDPGLRRDDVTSISAQIHTYLSPGTANTNWMTSSQAGGQGAFVALAPEFFTRGCHRLERGRRYRQPHSSRRRVL
jgi:hypothetical protein